MKWYAWLGAGLLSGAASIGMFIWLSVSPLESVLAENEKLRLQIKNLAHQVDSYDLDCLKMSYSE